MKRFLTALVLMFALSNCTHAYRPTSRFEAPKQSAVTVDHKMLRDLQGASAKFIAYQKMYIADPEKGIIISGSVAKWSGSAFCIGIEKDEKGMRRSIWATCRHVADLSELGPEAYGQIDFLNSAFGYETAYAQNIKVSQFNDIAIFESYAIPARTLTLASDETVENLSLGDYLIAVGHPAGAFPAFVTFGAYIGENLDDIRFTTSGYYGSSGSAMIDARTMTVVGVLYKYGGARHRYGFRSDDLVATKTSVLRKFLRVRNK